MHLPATHSERHAISFMNVGKILHRFWLCWGVAAMGALLFMGAPGSYSHTAHEVLHGLCAQTPSHTIRIGGHPLPFDSRMTGIYGGFLLTLLIQVWRRAVFRYGPFPRPVLAVMAALVGAMAVDGFNSLLRDLLVWHPYMPSNALRVITGYGAGCALALGLCWLVGSSAWKMSGPSAPIERVFGFTAPLIGLFAYGAVLFLRPSWIQFPLTALLVMSAWITVSMLVLVIVLLAFRLDEKIRRLDQLHVPFAIAGMLGIAVILLLAAARFWVERTFGITNAMM